MTPKPPIPAEQRSPKERGRRGSDARLDDPEPKAPDNVDQTGERANIKQNTSNQQNNR
jgi:hypothetical protein